MSVFKDRGRLSPSYIPSLLPHRDSQINSLRNFYSHVLESPSTAYPLTCQVLGGVGTGKTCTALRFGEALEKDAKSRGINLKHAYLNLKTLGGRVIVHRALVEQVAPKPLSTSLSPYELLRAMLDELKSERRYVLITVDEIDYYVKHYPKESVVYDLTRINELTPGRPCGVVGMIFIARDRRFRESLDPSEQSTLGRNYIEFPPYGSSQVYDILEGRVEEAFKPGAVSLDVLEYIADVTVAPPVHGDARYALDLLLYAGNLADNQGSSRVIPEHVRRVHSETWPGITEEDILSLPRKSKIALLGIVRSLQVAKEPYASLREIRDMSGVVCEEFEVRKFKDVEEYVQDLCDRGLIDIKSLTQIGISNVTTEDLERFLSDILKRVKGGME